MAASTTATIVANKLLPGLLDVYLARTGYDAQQTDEPVDPGRPDNLFSPVASDMGPRGDFDERSHARSLQWWATRHRRSLTAAAIGVTAAGIRMGVTREARRR